MKKILLIIGIVAVMFSCKKEEIQPIYNNDVIEINNCGVVIDSGLDTLLVDNNHIADYWVVLENHTTNNPIKIYRRNYEESFPTRDINGEEYFYYLDNGDTLCLENINEW